MKRLLPFPVLFALALTFVSLLPLYIERTMTHIMFADGSGGTVEWGRKVCTLRTFFSDYRYFRHNPHPELWIAMNILLALSYALIIALLLSRLFNRGPKQT
ncbi:MAG: hypothetical protein QOJ45_2226 [Verrucomicrobiota bacterium]|jgi:hypothetical protein